ncbi:hypothetical protein K469DRAFT_63160 [Zopfia rhizophila CBS 207.26]|uniref:REJ domain-containing protein n=1 Tax=Zopfia rhizophila CBS 207.26 TaxID=1314779 RepID=A0A6A6EHH8_9PEZI|nr:hypothetical protein K469DRAFT_63160 [Zopfia rhizophila CBS 207.26]
MKVLHDVRANFCILLQTSVVLVAAQTAIGTDVTSSLGLSSQSPPPFPIPSDRSSVILGGTGVTSSSVSSSQSPPPFPIPSGSSIILSGTGVTLSSVSPSQGPPPIPTTVLIGTGSTLFSGTSLIKTPSASDTAIPPPDTTAGTTSPPDSSLGPTDSTALSTAPSPTDSSAVSASISSGSDSVSISSAETITGVPSSTDVSSLPPGVTGTSSTTGGLVLPPGIILTQLLLRSLRPQELKSNRALQTCQSSLRACSHSSRIALTTSTTRNYCGDRRTR